MSIKNSNATIGNRTRDLPACRAVPQPTAPPRAPHTIIPLNNYLHPHFYFTFALNFHLHKDSARVKLIILSLQFWVAMFVTTQLQKHFFKMPAHLLSISIPSTKIYLHSIHIYKTNLYAIDLHTTYLHTVYPQTTMSIPSISMPSISTPSSYQLSPTVCLHTTYLHTIYPQTTTSIPPISMASISTPSSYKLSPTMYLHAKLHLSGSSERLKPPSNRQLQLPHDATFLFYSLHG